jgi:tetratricopeptide (TPR) repeat protein
MYLRGSKWSNSKRRRRSNPWLVLFLLVLIGALIYVDRVIVPVTPPLFIPTPTATRSPESFVADASDLESQGKLSQAIQAYQDAIQADPKSVSIYLSLAKLLAYTNRYSEALNNVENALLLNPNNTNALALRGWIKGFLGDWLEAEASLKRAIELDDKSATAYAYYAEMLALQSQAGEGSLGTLDKAIEMSRMAKDLAPDALESHRARGIVLELTSNYGEAASEFEAAIAKNPNIAELHMALGRNYRFQQLYDQAVEEFNRANALNPSDPLPDTYISRTYATVGQFAKAIQFAQQAVKDSPQDSMMQGNLGVMFYRDRQYKNALPPLQLAVRGGVLEDGKEVKGLPLDYGRVAEYYYTYGLALARAGECGEALQLAQLLQQGVSKDEIAMYNAQEMINICEQLVDGTPEPEVETPTEIVETQLP